LQSDEQIQRAYYARTAGQYAASHEQEESPHDRSLVAIDGLASSLGARSVLDVGSGVGRAVRYFQGKHADWQVRGVEPVAELIAQAERQGAQAGAIVQGDGRALPFPDRSFDVVTAFGVLHHVRTPAQVISEMLRVARKAVFISDGNRFAQGRPLARYAKLGLATTRLWRAFDWVRTGGKGYMVSEGDGLYYSYSVFDSIGQLRAASDRLLIAEMERAPTLANPSASVLLNAPTVLVGALL
jgi:SAM-dependent methyltransferase